jgi:hypothetical protein
MEKKISLILIAGLCMMTAGCATIQPMSPLERRAVESKDLRSSYDNAYRAALTVLQDNGYAILTTDYQGGLIRATTGEKPAPYLRAGEIEDRPDAVDILGILTGPTNKSEAADVTVTVEKYTEEITKMRITVDRHIYSKKGRRVGSERVYEPATLQKYYAAIEKEILMREQLEKQ